MYKEKVNIKIYPQSKNYIKLSFKTKRYGRETLMHYKNKVWHLTLKKGLVYIHSSNLKLDGTDTSALNLY